MRVCTSKMCSRIQCRVSKPSLSIKIFTPADYSKYEIFFGPDQTWPSAKGGRRFSLESSAETGSDLNVDVVEFVDENYDVANAYFDHGADDTVDHDALSPEVPEQVHLQQPSSLSPGIIGDHPVHSSSYGSSKRGTYLPHSKRNKTILQTMGPCTSRTRPRNPNKILLISYMYLRASWMAP